MQAAEEDGMVLTSVRDRCSGRLVLERRYRKDTGLHNVLRDTLALMNGRMEEWMLSCVDEERQLDLHASLDEAFFGKQEVVLECWRIAGDARAGEEAADIASSGVPGADFNSYVSGSNATVNNAETINNYSYNDADPSPSDVDMRKFLCKLYQKEIEAHVMFGMEEVDVEFKDVFLKPHVALWDPKNKESNSVRLKGQPYDVFAHLKQRATLWGKAGAGKSSLCQWIAYEWSRGNLPDIEWVIYVDLTRVAPTQVEENESFVSMLHQYWNKANISAADVEDFMDRIENYVVVFDGLDEARALSGGKNKHFDSFLKNVCNPKWKDLSGASGVLLAGRPPEKAGDVGPGWKPQLEVIGFGEQEREKYVMPMFCGNESQGTALLEQIRIDQVIADLASVPLQLQLICALRLSGRQERFECAADLLTMAIDEFLFRGMKAKDPTDEQFEMRDGVMARLTELSISEPLVLNVEDEVLLSRCGVVYRVKQDASSVGGRRQKAKVEWRWYHESFRDYFRAMRGVQLAASSAASGLWIVANHFHISMNGASVNCFRMAMWLSKEKEIFDGCFIGWLFSLTYEEIQMGGLVLSAELEGWEKVDLVMPNHLKRALDEENWKLKAKGSELKRFGIVLQKIGSINYFAGRSTPALQALEASCAVLQRVLGEEHPDYLVALSSLAGALQLMGKYQEALDRHEAVQVAQCRVLGEEHPDYLMTLAKIAGGFRSMGKYQEALDQFEAVRAVQCKVLGQEHPHYLVALSSIADVYNSMGKYQEASDQYEAVRVIERKVLGEEHPNYLTTLHNTAGIYNSMGNYQEALDQYEVVRVVQLKVLGQEHPSYLTTLNNIAGIYESMGRYQEALDQFEAVRAVECRVLGEEHPSYLATLGNIASIYRSMGKYQEALDRYEAVRGVECKVLGEAHPYYLVTLHNIAHIHQLIGNYQEALGQYEAVQAVRSKLLGQEHPDCLMTLSNIADIYKSMGKYQDAWGRYEAVRAARLKVLGEEHPNYLTTLGNIAHVHKSMGLYQEALDQYEAVRVVQCKVLGEEHPSHLETLHSIAYTHNLMNESQKCVAILQKIVPVALRTNHPRAKDWETSLQRLSRVKGSAPIKKGPKPKPNEKCPLCNSGKKYKKCCMNK